MIDIQIEHTRSASNECYVKNLQSDKLEQLGREPSRRNTEPKLEFEGRNTQLILGTQRKGM